MIEKLLTRLERVRKTGQGQWIASCPCRSDRSPSLSIRLTDDGRVLLHDFGGSSVPEILGALGMDMADLFPAKPEKAHAVKGGRFFDAYTALKAMADDMSVGLIGLRMLARGESLPETDIKRFAEAAARFQEAKTFVLGVGR